MLTVPHVQQTNPEGRNSCVPACLSMVPAHQGVSWSEQELCDLLNTTLVGTEVWTVLILNRHISNCRVNLDSMSFARVHEALNDDAPPIAFVVTRHLSYWQRDTIHAVVVVGITEGMVHVNDPSYPDAPREIPYSEFTAAWSELDFLTAIVKIKKNSA